MIIGIVLLGFLLTATTVSAEKAIILHVVGTVTAIDKKHIAVKTTGKTARFKDKNRLGSNEPPVVGDHVIIEAKKENKALFATVVHYSAMRKATAPLSGAAP
jgi:ribosomal protein S1